MRMNMLTKSILLGSTMLCLATPAFAVAEAAPAKADEGAENAPIVVTGTLIRGAEVTGSQTIAVDSKAIVQQGANSTNQLLGLIPQIANAFNGRFEADPRGAKAITIARPNLRNLPGLTSSSGAVTLVLVDGMRITPVGIKESAIDPDTIPSAILDGVDVVTDGGSSLYGADAVAGVINFRTKKKFDGVKIDGNFGFGTTLKHYSQWDGAITAGKSWATGNAYVSAGYSSRDFIANGETSWANGVRYSATGVASVTGTQCLTPVGTQTNWKHFNVGVASWTSNPLAAGAGVVALGTACDQVTSGTYLPKQTRMNVFASLTQEVADNIGLHVTAYWTKRDTKLFDYPLGFTSAGSTITTGAQVGAIFGDPAVNTIVSIPGGIGFSFGANAAYVTRPSELKFETWGITPELTFKLGGDWQLRTTLHFGRSVNSERFPEVNGVLAQCYITGCAGIAAGQLNPQNVGAASAAVIADILNFETAQDTTQELFVFRSIADGTIFQLPGGAAKLAVGIEYQSPSAKTRLGTQARGAISTIPLLSAQRNSKSAFAEVSLPLADFINVSGSVRYDNYSDFGSTTNPNIGVTLKPVEGLKFFGHWNKSFNAPTTLDSLPLSLGRQGGIIYCNNLPTCPHPTDPLGKWTGIGSKSLVLEGPGFGLKPQTATSWALGFEATPLGGLRFGGEFYSIDFKNVLGGVDVVNTQSYIDFPQYFTFSSDPNFAAKYASLVSTLANAGFVTSNIAVGDVAIIVDRRTTNLNNAKLEGVDFHAYYDTDVSFGHLGLGINGTKTTKSKLITGTITADTLGTNSPELAASAFVAVNAGPFSTRLTVNYSGAFHDGSTDNLGNVVEVKPFVTANLFLGYDFGKEGGPLNGTSLRLSVDNVLDKKPQYVQRPAATSALTYVNYTLGRVIKLGFSKAF